jgi:four helix bundle protein
MHRSFRAYDLAVQFYRQSKSVKLPQFLRVQLLRASSSVALNLLEGNAKSSVDDRCRFFEIALGSLRESTAICDLEPAACASLRTIGDQLGATIYCLIRSLRR